MIAENINTLRNQITVLSQHYQAQTPQLLAVSKKQPIAAIKAAVDAGQQHFGESYVQEAVGKIQTLQDLDLTWHFIGPIQSNKTKLIAENFDWVHSVDREKIAQRLNDQRPAHLPPLYIFLQVNVDQEAQKSGFAPDQVLSAARHIMTLPNLKLHGLMAIPKARETLTKQQQPYQVLHDLLRQCQQAEVPMTQLSMGMSGDMEAAIAQGSNWLRIGTALFGARP